MSIVIDANMKLFAERMNITSSRMIREYGLSTVDEIIEAEAERGNTQAVKYAREIYHSPEKLIKIFKLTDIENKFVLLHNMDSKTREKILPMLNREELVMGLYFFTQEKLLAMLAEVDIEELVNVVKEAFPLEQIIMMFTEDDLANFFMHEELDRNDVIEQITVVNQSDSYFRLVIDADYITTLIQNQQMLEDVDTVSGATISSTALKEAVKSQVLNFRYIEGILHNWAKNGVKTRYVESEEPQRSVPISEYKWWEDE